MQRRDLKRPRGKRDAVKSRAMPDMEGPVVTLDCDDTEVRALYGVDEELEAHSSQEDTRKREGWPTPPCSPRQGKTMKGLQQEPEEKR